MDISKQLIAGILEKNSSIFIDDSELIPLVKGGIQNIPCVHSRDKLYEHFRSLYNEKWLKNAEEEKDDFAPHKEK